ncbi:MAG TPA: thermosome subunit beta [Candidatus Dormibacteraeota bacterium]|nr:thermosome subunit beta [Candidatus Dormibacteraeota bacterium]
MSEGTVPIVILKEGSTRTRGRDAQRNNILAAKVVTETIRTTLGPEGMDKMLVAGMGDVVITNDGATIMKELDVQHPAAKMLVEVAKSQDNEVGDGTTTAVVLTGELLSKAEKLLDQEVHPTVIVEGYKKGSEKALEILDRLSVSIQGDDEKMLKLIAVTSMSTKATVGTSDHLAKLATEAVRQIAEQRSGKTIADIDRVKVVKKKGESMDQSELVKGIVIDKEVAHPQMPKQVKNAKIALLNAKLEIEKTEFDAKININSPDQMKLFLDEEESMLREMAEKVVKSGANVVLCEKGIDDMALHFLSKKNILAVKNVSSGDMEKLAKATGASILASTKDIASEALGEAKLVEEVKIGDDKLVYVRDCKDPHAVTVVIRGGSEHVVDEAERSFHDALCVVRNTVEDQKIVAGGGAPEAETAKQLRDFAVKVGGREQLAIEAYAEALEAIPITIAENAGLDPIDIMVELRSKHSDPANKWYGVQVKTGKIADMFAENVVEPLRVKQQVIKSATEAASMLLRIDDVVSSKGMKEGGPPGGMPGGGMPGGMPPGMM